MAVYCHFTDGLIRACYPVNIEGLQRVFLQHLPLSQKEKRHRAWRQQPQLNCLLDPSPLFQYLFSCATA